MPSGGARSSNIPPRLYLDHEVHAMGYEAQLPMSCGSQYAQLIAAFEKWPCIGVSTANPQVTKKMVGPALEPAKREIESCGCNVS